MPKRKLEEDLEADWAESSLKPGVKKNSLDSDEEEEDDHKRYEILAEDDIEGQEEGNAGFDGDVKITPFNMKEELEEGHFDVEGNYHLNKEKLIRDNWLENIDWVKIKSKDGEAAGADGDDSASDISSVGTPFDHIAVYKEMLGMMRPGETVAKTLRRLGGTKSLSASERWRRKKQGLDTTPQEGSQQDVTQLTELANTMLTRTGNMDIYQESYEHIAGTVREADRRSLKTKAADELDMYADDFEEKEKAKLSNVGDDKESDAAGSSTGGAGGEPAEVTWELKWSQDGADAEGPYSTEQMDSWAKEGRFKAGAWVRRRGQQGPFYSTQRVDFELYL